MYSPPQRQLIGGGGVAGVVGRLTDVATVIPLPPTSDDTFDSAASSSQPLSALLLSDLSAKLSSATSHLSPVGDEASQWSNWSHPAASTLPTLGRK